MAKKSKKGVNLTMEDAAFTVGGAVAGLGLNFVANKVLQNQNQEMKDTIGKVVPLAKIAAGGYVATNKKMDRRLRFAAIGMAATGGVEAAIMYGPKEYFAIGTTDVFDMLGSTDDVLELDYVPSATVDTSGYVSEGVMGTSPAYAEALL